MHACALNASAAGGEELSRAALAEAAAAPPGVMGTLAAITGMPAGPGFDAFMQLVDARAQVCPLLGCSLCACMR